MDSVADDRFLFCRVSPFGNLRIDAYVPLPGAYRSLSRPSSAPDAKAFPLRSFSLNLLVLKNYAGSIRLLSSVEIVTHVFHNLLQTLPSVALLVLCSLFSFQCADPVVADLAAALPPPGFAHRRKLACARSLLLLRDGKEGWLLLTPYPLN